MAREMKKFISVFTLLAVVPCLSWGAINVKKSAAVAPKKTETVESATSLLPGVIGLVSNVKTLTAKQKQLDADCVPTSDEINTVNMLVKEWAKTGEVDNIDAVSGLGVQCVTTADDDFYANRNNDSYRVFLDINSDDDCYVQFGETTEKGLIWYGFPKATSAKLCPDGGTKNCKTRSNIYDIFTKITFSDEDYNKAELAKVTKLIEKSERCAPEKIKAAKRELAGGFLTQTLGSIGQTSGAAGTADIMNAVSSMGGSGSITSMLPGLGQMAMQSFDK